MPTDNGASPQPIDLLTGELIGDDNNNDKNDDVTENCGLAGESVDVEILEVLRQQVIH